MLKKRTRGFTLVELIVVIIILGILAALAIPQFVTSTQDAKEATLQANIAVVRNAVNLYYHQHNSTYPGVNAAGAAGSGGGAGTAQAFTSQLTEYSKADGNTDDSLDRSTFPFGPYFANGLPENPINGLTTVLMVAQATNLDAGDITDATGWIFNPTTGEVRANSTGYIAY